MGCPKLTYDQNESPLFVSASNFGGSEKRGLGFNHFELREYDPVINRWLVPDPYKQFWSPYLSMGNNWVNVVDPTGGWGTGKEDCPECDASMAQWGDLAERNAVTTSLTLVDKLINLYESMDFVAEASSKIDVGIAARFKGSNALAKASLDVNVVSATMVEGKVDLTNVFSSDAWSGEYVGDGKGLKLTNSIGAKVSTPIAAGSKVDVGIKAYAEQTQRVHGSSGIYRSTDYSSDAGVDVFVTLYSKSTGNAGNAPMRIPTTKVNLGENKDFFGIDISAGAQLILGADVNVKIGFQTK